jgi:hypothetical protein
MEASGRGIPLGMLQVVLKSPQQTFAQPNIVNQKILDGSKPIDNPMPFEYAITR